MLEVAAQQGDGSVTLHVADMRELPHFGDFDLVLSLNDSVNYLLGDDDLARALAGMAANLAEGGLLIFDVNSSSTFASGYEEVREVEHTGSRWVWAGKGEVAPSVFEAEIAGDRLPEPVRQMERFRSQREVLEAMRSAGLRTLAACGMSEADGKVLLSESPDESRDYKLVFIGGKANNARTRRRSPSSIADVDRPPFIWGS
jgi:SAM-dependent methyltransferase